MINLLITLQATAIKLATEPEKPGFWYWFICEIFGAIFYVWDTHTIYSLVTAFDVSHGNVASSSLLFYQIMKDFKNSSLKFDFEGSMVESIERSYNKFGTNQVPYFRVSKINSRRFKIYSLLSELRNEFRN